MKRRALMTSAVACLGLGAVDLALLNLRLVPAALSAGADLEVEEADVGARLDAEPETPPASAAAAPEGDVASVEAEGDVASVEVEPEVALGDAEPERALVEPERAPEPEPELAPGLEGAGEEEPVVLRFETGRAELDRRARRELAPLRRRLERDDALVVRIEGHADERGSSRFNAALGRQRAEAVAEHLAERGIARARLSLRSFGEDRPLVRGTDDTAHRRNRRVEIVLQRGTR